MTLTRRDLLARSAAGIGLLAVGNIDTILRAAPAGAAPSGANRDLEPDPAGLLDLPAGFAYTIVTRSGDPMNDGTPAPEKHDGMAAFKGPKGGVRLVTNHELGGSAAFPAIAAAALTYDPAAKGGTTTVTVDKDNRRVDEYVSLAGTFSNCAGGLTPWGTWLTCEETEQKRNTTFTKDHGFVFEVDPDTPSNNMNPTPLAGLGRFAHEAVAVDPHDGTLYLTEDASSPNGLLYRFTPSDRSRKYGALRDGGLLEAMHASKNGVHVPDLSVFSTPGTWLNVGWTAVPDPSAATLSIRKQFTNAQVTRSRKYEGVWYGDGKVFIVCSFARLSDGSLAEHDGQVWSYDANRNRLTLEVHFPRNPDVASDNPDGPDNITVSPWGGLFLAEDGEGVQHLLAVNDKGETWPFARNRLNEEEFAGVCFSPDRQTMFANIQSPGITFAITGPFNKIRK